MKLIRLGSLYINMDQVCMVEYVDTKQGFYSGAGYKLYTNQIIDGEANYFWVGSSDADPLELWLNRNSEDCTSASDE